ncbi:LCP family protein [Rathayibacter toxicus]|uniref:LCP family protein n=1 Tax=Rathayibacter toxicus TaxID=145458 RepID=UPI000698784F|nr:LCP family protein [Rathayibacter toxicus]ALS57497.1 hypothetical protein APU90_06725 [Rathayibacter toxicus]PPG20832.1 LytR family transcriptional regulator [Rathayibacter toxicus]PPG45936.1 LytR family transcriptional regulator [Rathayibacter toxicus]PPH62514.1 LytR family transcriptional regulator [Rathayibacter toxicus]PPH67124.1 LytR family transcriptional regulator [Rathayibacter toxicus]
MTNEAGGFGAHKHPNLPASVGIRRVLIAIVASVVMPGLGHRLLGSRRSATVRLLIAGITLACLLILAITLRSEPSTLVALATSPQAVLVAGGIGASLGLFWASGPVATGVFAWHRLPRSGARTALALTTVIVTALPLGVTTWWVTAASAQHQLLSTVFASGRGIVPVNGRYNILLMGLDADPLRDQVLLPDSLTLVSVDAVTGRSVLFGIPRTASNFLYPAGSALAHALPDGLRCHGGCGINHLYQYGLAHPNLYPGSTAPGDDALRDAVEGYSGLPVSATVSIKMTGFVDLISALGGVSVILNRPVLQAGVPDNGSGRPIEYGPPLPSGLQHLDGSQALWFARSRVNTSDADRSERQACLQAALFRQVTPLTVLTRFTDIARSGAETVATSLPTETLPALARLAEASRAYPFVRIELGEPLTLPEQPDTELVHRTVAAAIAGNDDSGALRIAVPQPDAAVDAPAVTVPAQPAEREAHNQGPACSVP